MKLNVLTKTEGMTRAEWLNIRRQGMGGSDAAAIFGLDSHRGPLSVYLSKVGQTPDREPSEVMEWGNILEDTIAQVFAKKTGFTIRPCDAILQHPEHPFMLANIDRLVLDPEEGEEGILEVKNVGEYNAEEWADGAIPKSFQIQAQHYMAVTGAGYVWFAPLIGGNKLRPVKLLRDERMIAAIIKKEADFWDKIQKRVPPPLDGSVDAEKILKFIYPESTEESILLDDSLFNRLKAARQRRIDAEFEERELENKVKELMKDAGAAYVAGNDKPVVTWKGSSVKRLNVSLLEDAEPELCAKYMTETTTRRFLVK